MPSEATTCDELSRRTASRYIRHSRRPVKLAPPATLPKSHFPLPSNSDSSHRLRVFNAFIIPDLMIPGLVLLSSRIYYKLNARQYSWNNIINRIGIILFDRVLISRNCGISILWFKCFLFIRSISRYDYRWLGDVYYIFRNINWSEFVEKEKGRNWRRKYLIISTYFFIFW